MKPIRRPKNTPKVPANCFDVDKEMAYYKLDAGTNARHRTWKKKKELNKVEKTNIELE